MMRVAAGVLVFCLLLSGCAGSPATPAAKEPEESPERRESRQGSGRGSFPGSGAPETPEDDYNTTLLETFDLRFAGNPSATGESREIDLARNASANFTQMRVTTKFYVSGLQPVYSGFVPGLGENPYMAGSWTDGGRFVKHDLDTTTIYVGNTGYQLQTTVATIVKVPAPQTATFSTSGWGDLYGTVTLEIVHGRNNETRSG